MEERQHIYTGIRGVLAGMLAEHETPLCLEFNRVTSAATLGAARKTSQTPGQNSFNGAAASSRILRIAWPMSACAHARPGRRNPNLSHEYVDYMENLEMDIPEWSKDERECWGLLSGLLPEAPKDIFEAEPQDNQLVEADRRGPVGGRFDTARQERGGEDRPPQATSGQDSGAPRPRQYHLHGQPPSWKKPGYKGFGQQLQ